MNSEMKVPENFRPLFWDVEWEKLDALTHQEFIMERVLNMGDETAVRWIIDTYSLDKVESLVKTSRRLSRKTARCWQNLLGLKEEEMCCFGTYSTSPDNYYSKN